jgi:hypothetical protein
MNRIYSSAVMVVSLIRFVSAGMEPGGGVALVFYHTARMMAALTGQ